MEGQYDYRYISLKPATGGYIVTCTKYEKNVKDEYDGYRHVGEMEEIYEDRDEALDRVDELAKMSSNLKKISIKKKGSSMTEE